MNILKHFSYWEIERYCKPEDIEYSPVEFTEIYKGRKYDFMDADEPIICEFAGISKKALPNAYKSLAQHYFIELLGFYGGRKVWKVLVNPTKYYKRDWLNRKLKKRYG